MYIPPPSAAYAHTKGLLLVPLTSIAMVHTWLYARLSSACCSTITLTCLTNHGEQHNSHA